MTAPTLRFDVGSSRNVIGVNLATLLGTRMLVQANSGGGKSRFIRAMCEQLFGQTQIIVLDTEGEFDTLRERFPFVLCGKDQDVPVYPKLAKTLCRQLMNASASAVVSLYDLKLHERREFVKLFLDELMTLPKSLWRPLVLVLDEAHNYAPQSSDSVATEAVVTLCTQGRKRGYCAVLATQRMSKLHKDATAELLNRAIGRTGQDLDMKRAGDELGMTRDGALSLRSLSPGHFHVFGPAFGDGVQLVQSANVLTTHPEAGTIGTFTPPANQNVKALLEKIGDLPAIANKDIDEKAALQQRVKQLEADSRKRPVGAAPSVSEETIRTREQAAFARGAESVNARERQLGFNEGKTIVLERVRDALRPFELMASVGNLPTTFTPTTAKRGPHAASPALKPVRITPVSSGDISRTQQNMINAMAAMERIGITPQTRVQIAAWIGVSHDTGTFRNNLTDLRQAGLITDVSKSDLILTEDGHQRADADRIPIASRDDLHRIVLGKFGATPAKMLRVLLDAYPLELTRQAIAESIDVSHDTGTFRNNLTTLRNLSTVIDVSKTALRANDWLFPAGLH